MTETLAKFELKYGSETIDFALPDSLSVDVLTLPNHSLQIKEQDILDIRLRNPIGSPGLIDLLASKQRILIIVPHKTQFAKLDLVFSKILEILQQKNIEDECITILFANGSYPRMTEEEKIEILGFDIYNRFKVIEHNCQDAVVEKLGNTSRGTHVVINPLVKRHDKIITINSVTHHNVSGFDGGPKMIIPGLATLNTIWQNQQLALMPQNSSLHPACEPGNLHQNPVYEDIVEAVKSVPVDFSINLVFGENQNLIDAFCGNMNSSFQKACFKINQNNVLAIPELADVVIASTGGWPNDINLIQAYQSIHFAVRALKPNGDLIILSECREGLGNYDFLSWFENNNQNGIINGNLKMNADIAISLKQKLDNYNVYLFSEISEADAKKIGFIPTSNIQEAFEQVFSSNTETKKVYIIPNASVLLPKIQ